MIKECLLSSEVRVRNIEGDGNCLFRAAGSQLYGESDYHDIIRSACMDYIELNKELFSEFVHEYPSIEKYIQEKRRLGVWGDNIEIQALSDLYRIPVYIYEKVRNSKLNSNFLEKHKLEKFSNGTHNNIFYNDKESVYQLLCMIEPKSSNVFDQIKNHYSNSRPIRLLYHNDLHYDSLFCISERQAPIIDMEIGLIEARIIKSLKTSKAFKKQAKQEAKNENPKERNSDLKTDLISNLSTAPCALLRKRVVKQFPTNFESSSESDNYCTAKSPFFSYIDNKYRDEPDVTFKGNCLDTISDGEAHFERLSLKSQQLYSKFISGPKSSSKKPAVKPAHFSKIKSFNTNLGVVDRYARDIQLSSHQKELKKLLTNDSLRPFPSQNPGKNCVAIYCPIKNSKQNTFRN